MGLHVQVHEGGKWRYMEGWTKVYKGLYKGVQRYAGVLGGLPLPTIDLVGDNREIEAYFEVLYPFWVVDSLRTLKVHHYLCLVIIGCPSTHPAVYFCIPPHTSVYLHTPLYTPLHNSVHLCMPSHTSTHLPAPLCKLPCISVYLCTPPHTSMHQAVPFYAYLCIPLCTSVQLHIPPCTSAYLSVHLCIPLHTAACLCASLYTSAQLCIPLHTSIYLCITPSMNFIG